MSYVDKKDNELKKLEDDNMDKVSGGYRHANGSIRCDNCDCFGAFPIDGGHLCEACLKKRVKILGK